MMAGMRQRATNSKYWLSGARLNKVLKCVIAI
jgi:hypothetical protein